MKFQKCLFSQTCGKEPTDTFNAFKLGKAVDGTKVKALVFYIKDKKEIVLEKTLGTKGGCEDANWKELQEYVGDEPRYIVRNAYFFSMFLIFFVLNDSFFRFQLHHNYLNIVILNFQLSHFEFCLCVQLYDMCYNTDDGRPQAKIVFIFWSPDSGPVMKKMLYASSKAAIVTSFSGIAKEYQANDQDDLDKDEVIKKCKS